MAAKLQIIARGDRRWLIREIIARGDRRWLIRV